MSTVIVFVKYNGHWGENNIHITNDSLGVLVPVNTLYVDLLEILCEALELNPENYVMHLNWVALL